MGALHQIAISQAEWSATANKLKQSFQTSRWISFGLSITAAMLAATASQLNGDIRLILSILSAAIFGIVTFLTARLVTDANTQEWVRARAASELLKREMYIYAAAACPYNDPKTRDRLLSSATAQIVQQVGDLLSKRITSLSEPTPKFTLSPQDYIRERVARQEKWYRDNANNHRVSAQRLRRAEFLLALITAVITAAAGVFGKDVNRSAGGFDFVALTAVLTTISGAILAHIEASRYDFLILTYRAASQKLREALANDVTHVPGSEEWSDFVQSCEDIIANENGCWVLKMGRASGSP